jgi:hypothetical protein
MQSAHSASGTPQAEELKPPPASLTIQPAVIMTIAGESQRLRLIDDRGRRISGAVWTVNEPARGEVKVDSEAIFNGLAPGTVIVTATWGKLKAQAKVIILGDPLPPSEGEPAKSMTPPGTPNTPASMQSDSERFEMTPYIVNMVAGETHRLRMWDNASNHAVGDAEWTVSDPSVATVEGGLDAEVLARAPGKVTVTSTWQGHQTEAIITVYPGTQLPTGTVIWSQKPHPGQTTKIVPAVPN